MTQAYLDTNVLLRFITNDVPDQAARAEKLFEALERGQVTLILPELVLGEVVWTLQSFYGAAPRAIAEVLVPFLAQERLRIAEKEVALEALTLFAGENTSFADALLAAYARKRGPRRVYSFDRRLSRLPGLERLEP